MKRRIRVRQEEIDKGRHGARTCPIAAALNEHLDGVGAVVYLTTSRTAETDFYGSGVAACTTRLPRSVARFITAYDKRKPVLPFEFFFTFPEGLDEFALPTSTKGNP